MSQPSIQILDGGMSRELIRLKAPFHQPEWSALALSQAPHLVQQVHEEFIAAGANIITTNSYAVVPFHIGKERFQNEGEDLARLAGKLARTAADEELRRSGRRVLVAGSLPPIFGSYEPQLFDGSTVQEHLSVLVRGLTPYVDLWLGETLSLIAEAEAVRVAVADSGKPFWIAFTLDDGDQLGQKGEYVGPARLRSGESVTDAARWVADSGATALLFNCSQPEFMKVAVRDAKSVFDEMNCTVAIGVYANSFEPKSDTQSANVEISSTRQDMTAESYVNFARDWIANGASIVGGCCGIGCEHIKYLAEALASHDKLDIKSNYHNKA